MARAYVIVGKKLIFCKERPALREERASARSYDVVGAGFGFWWSLGHILSIPCLFLFKIISFSGKYRE